MELDGARISPLRRDVLDDLLGVPLAAEDAPLHVTLHPKKALSFGIGEGTATSALLTASLAGLELDIEGGVSEGGFEGLASVTTDVSEQLTFTERHVTTKTALDPTLLGVSATNTSVTGLGARYAGLSPANASAYFSTIGELVFGTLGSGDVAFAGPAVLGRQATELTFGKAVTTQGNFLSIQGTLVNAASSGTKAPAPTPVTVTVTNGDRATVQAALRGAGGALPKVELTFDPADATDLEYAWRFAGGTWRAFRAGNELVIEDRIFAWQGSRTLELRARVARDPSTTSDTAHIDVVIDYAPPTIFTDQASIDAGNLRVPARDAVSLPAALSRAITAVGRPAPAASAYHVGDTLPLGALATGTDVTVYVKDEAGHVASATVHLRDAADGGAPPNGGADGSVADSGANTPGTGGAGGGTSGIGGSSGGTAGTAGRSSGGNEAAGAPSTHADASVHGDGGPSHSDTGSDSGCGCRAVGGRSSEPGAWIAVLGLLIAMRRRRGAER